MFGLSPSKLSPEEELILWLAEMSDRPLDFVIGAFPWGEKGTELENQTGPDVWQRQVLGDLQEAMLSGQISAGEALSEAYRIAVRSGHGVGKSAFFSWIILWGISTLENTRGRVTANTKEQLMRVLWGELSKWHRLFIGRSMFRVTATAIMSADPTREKEWRIDAIPWSEENPEAFAGLHNYGKRIIILCDEASAIVDSIWEVLDGATTDINTQIIWAVAGNPTRNAGRFRDCWERFSELWHTYQVDARSSKFSNKKLIAQWARDWGEDSDFFRVRVRGEFPNAASTQLIPLETIQIAQQREVNSYFREALILGVDIARFGTNESVAVFRRGRDARTMPALRWNGLSVVESGNRIAGLITQYHPDGVFIDEGGVGGGVVDFVKSLGHRCIGVNFGSKASTRPNGTLVANKRAEMFVALRDWLREGGCIEVSEDLSSQLISIEYHYNQRTEILLVSKEDMRNIGKPSPDWADALAMTFAFPVNLNSWASHGMKSEYDPLSFDRIAKGPDVERSWSMH